MLGVLNYRKRTKTGLELCLAENSKKKKNKRTKKKNRATKGDIGKKMGKKQRDRHQEVAFATSAVTDFTFLHGGGTIDFAPCRMLCSAQNIGAISRNETEAVVPDSLKLTETPRAGPFFDGKSQFFTPKIRVGPAVLAPIPNRVVRPGSGAKIQGGDVRGRMGLVEQQRPSGYGYNNCQTFGCELIIS